MRRRPSPIPEGLESETAQSQVSYQATLIERYLLVFTSPDSLLIHNPRRAIPRILPRHEHTVKRIDQSRLVPPSPFQSEDLPKEIETAQSKRPRYTRHRRSETIPSISPANSTAERTSYLTRIVPKGSSTDPRTSTCQSPLRRYESTRTRIELDRHPSAPEGLECDRSQTQFPTTIS